MQFVAPDATKGGVDGGASRPPSWRRRHHDAVHGPGRSSTKKKRPRATLGGLYSLPGTRRGSGCSSRMGAAWRSSVVPSATWLFGGATRVAAETSQVRGRSGRGDGGTKSKTMTKTNNPPRAPAEASRSDARSGLCDGRR